MRNVLMALAAAALVAAAFFLPEQLSLLEDQQLLDRPNIVQQEEREGFAESMQLQVAEKLLLMRSATVSRMELGDGVVQGLYDMGTQETTLLTATYEESANEQKGGAAWLKTATDEELERFSQEQKALWTGRLAEVRRELRTLQGMGGLPALWSADSQLEFTGLGDLLYMDTASQMSFQVYRMSLNGAPYSINLTVDIQSGRILAFQLDWDGGMDLDWGFRGAAGFGGAWRDYWGMDSVKSDWYGDYNRSILEETCSTTQINGDYTAHGQISFTYDSQSIPVSLECWAMEKEIRLGSLMWNLLQGRSAGALPA